MNDPNSQQWKTQVISNKTAYTVTLNNINTLLMVNNTAAQTTITLPNSTRMGKGFFIGIQKTDSLSSNIVYITPQSSQTIEGKLYYTIRQQYEIAYFTSDGTTNWQLAYSFIPRQVLKFNTPGTYTITAPRNVSTIYAQLFGAGAQGGGALSATAFHFGYVTASVPLGGGSGAYCEGPTTVTGNTSYSLVVGAGGARKSDGGGFAFGESTTFNGLTAGGGITSLAQFQVGIYGVRQVNLFYAGPIFNVRRSSDNVTADVYSDSAGNLTVSSTTLTSWLNGATAYVPVWYDQSGKGSNATQTNTSYQPTFNTTSGFMSFTSNAYMGLPDGTVPYGNSRYTVMFRHNNINSVGGVILGSGTYGTNNSTNAFNTVSGGQYQNYWWNNDIYTTSNSVVAGNVYTVSYDLTSRTVYINGNFNNTQLFSSHQGTPIQNSIGAQNDGSNPANCELYYIYLFNTNLSSTQIKLYSASSIIPDTAQASGGIINRAGTAASASVNSGGAGAPGFSGLGAGSIGTLGGVGSGGVAAVSTGTQTPLELSSKYTEGGTGGYGASAGTAPSSGGFPGSGGGGNGYGTGGFGASGAAILYY